jgi:hypothetical protein
MGTFREFTVRPDEKAEVVREPDGTIEVRWKASDLTVLLNADEAASLASELTGAVLAGAHA